MDITQTTPTADETPPKIFTVLYKLISKIEVIVCYTTFIIGTVALALDIIGREFFSKGIFGAQRLAVYCIAIAGVMGFSYVVSHGGHLRPSILDKLVPPKYDRLAGRVADTISAVLCVLLAYGALLLVRTTHLHGEQDMSLSIPIWPIQSVLIVAFMFAASKYLLFAFYPSMRPTEEGGEI